MGTQIEAHAHAFAMFDGVPRRGIRDKLKTAVDRVGRCKERVVNAPFQARPKPAVSSGRPGAPAAPPWLVQGPMRCSVWGSGQGISSTLGTSESVSSGPGFTALAGRVIVLCITGSLGSMSQTGQ